MFKVFANAWKIEDLRKKLLFTAFIILIFRLGSKIPVPFLELSEIGAAFESLSTGTVFGFLNLMGGGALATAGFFSLSISPYINASIIMQLLGVAIPALERKMKEDGGQKFMEKWTRILTIVLALVLGFGYYTVLKNQMEVVTDGMAVFKAIVITVSFAAGAMIVMWLGDLINEKGIGNGISMILFAGIVAEIPNFISTSIALEQAKATSWLVLGIIVLVLLVMVAFVVFITNGERRIPVQYAKKVVGRKMYGGQNTNIPLKVNMTGVLPIIFAQSFVMLPATIANFFPKLQSGWFGKVVSALNVGGWAYTLIMFVLIIFFSYFYTVITFNPVEVASNLKKNGGFIMGIRPGKPTADYITKALNRITLIGALFLALIAAIPSFIAMFNENLNSLAIGGTTILIVVGVALETVKTLESQMLMRHYKGFLE